MQSVIYNKNKKDEWDDFVRKSKNGTFLLRRDFMEYHSDRFTDRSLMFYDKNELLAVLPGNISGSVYYSHQGLTYGGLILSAKIKTQSVLEIYGSLLDYLKSESIEKFVYKAIPHIYHKYPAEEDLYALYRFNARIESRAISSALMPEDKLNYSQLRKRQVKKGLGMNLSVEENDSFHDFWEILTHNLVNKYHKYPVHTIEEIEYLKKMFPQEIRLFCVSNGGKILAGCVVFDTVRVAHVQYIASNEEGREAGALDLLFDYLINRIFPEKKYFDFGISTENNGLFLNEGLISQKEGFGARGIVYDTYSVNI